MDSGICQTLAASPAETGSLPAKEDVFVARNTMGSGIGFANRLRVLRNAKGLSQPELGKRARLDHTYISRIETGRILTPKLPVLKRLAGGLEVELDQLLVPGGGMPETPTPRRPTHAQHQERLLLQAFREMSRKDRSLLVFMARKLVGSALKPVEEKGPRHSPQAQAWQKGTCSVHSGAREQHSGLFDDQRAAWLLRAECTRAEAANGAGSGNAGRL